MHYQHKNGTKVKAFQINLPKENVAEYQQKLESEIRQIIINSSVKIFSSYVDVSKFEVVLKVNANNPSLARAFSKIHVTNESYLKDSDWIVYGDYFPFVGFTNKTFLKEFTLLK